MANKYKMEQSIIKYRRRVKYVRPLEALVKILDGILLNGMEAAGGSGAEQCHVLIYILKISFSLTVVEAMMEIGSLLIRISIVQARLIMLDDMKNGLGYSVILNIGSKRGIVEGFSVFDMDIYKNEIAILLRLGKNLF